MPMLRNIAYPAIPSRVFLPASVLSRDFRISHDGLLEPLRRKINDPKQHLAVLAHILMQQDVIAVIEKLPGITVIRQVMSNCELVSHGEFSEGKNLVFLAN